MSEREIMTVDELGHYLHLHASTIYRLLRRRQIPGWKVGRSWRFNPSQIDQWRLAQENLWGLSTEKTSTL